MAKSPAYRTKKPRSPKADVDTAQDAALPVAEVDEEAVLDSTPAAPQAPAAPVAPPVAPPAPVGAAPPPPPGGAPANVNKHTNTSLL
jgi:localization factor PodJL